MISLEGWLSKGSISLGTVIRGNASAPMHSEAETEKGLLEAGVLFGGLFSPLMGNKTQRAKLTYPRSQNTLATGQR